MIRLVIDSLLYMGIGAGIIALLMLGLAGICRGRFNAKWHLAGWAIAMVTLLVPMYMLFSPDAMRLSLGQQDNRTAQYRIVITNTMDRDIGDIVHTGNNQKIPDSSSSQPAVTADSPAKTPVSAAADGSTGGKASAPSSASELPNQVSFTVREAFFAVWLAVALIMGAWKLFRYYSFRHEMLSSSRISDGRWTDVLPENMKKKVILREANIPSPIVFGVFHPMIVIPVYAKNRDAVHFALLHELQHVERHDLLLRLLAEYAAVIHWFNPFAWLIRNKVTFFSENACDESVAAQLSKDDRKGYAMAILDFMDDAVPEPDYPSTLMSFSGGTENLKKRIMSIMIYRKMKRPVLILSVCLMLSVSMIGTMAASNLAFSGSSILANIPTSGDNKTVDGTEKTPSDPADGSTPVITVNIPTADHLGAANKLLDAGDAVGAWNMIRDDYAQPDGPSLLQDIYKSIETKDDGLSGIGSIRGNTTGNIVNGGLSAAVGDWIYYSHNGLWKYNTATGENIRLLESSDSFPVKNINVVGDEIYYTCYAGDLYLDNCLYRIHTGGGDSERIFEGNCRSVSVVLDRIYVVLQNENTQRSIRVLTLDGAYVKELANKIYGNFSQISVLGGWVYYGTDAGDSMGSLNRISTDGSRIETVADGTFISACIVSAGKIYYASSVSAESLTDICSQNLDGSDRKTLLTDMNLNHFNVSGTDLFYVSNYNALGGHPMMKNLDGGKGKQISDMIYPEEITLVGNELANVYAACDTVYAEADFRTYVSGLEIS